MKFNYILTLLSFILVGKVAQAQCLGGPCLMDVQANKTTICVGDSVIINAFTGTQSLGNDFNSGTIGSGWATNNNVINFNNPCGPGLDGTPHVWFGSAAGTGTRMLQTVDFNTTLGGNICFDFKMARQGDASPCEGPDEADEGVSLQYSIDGGLNWVDIVYFSPDGNLLPSNPGGNNSITPPGGITQFTSWANYSFPIPPAAMTNSTRFRWFQPFNTSATNDHWGIDNVSVVTNQFVGVIPGFVWLDNGQLVNGPRVVKPTQTTTYIAEWNNAGVICRDSITIVVNPVPPTPEFTAPTVCSGQPFSVSPTNIFPGATYYWSASNGYTSNAVPLNLVGSAQWNGTMLNLQAVANGCSSQVYSQIIHMNNPPAFIITGNTDGCEGVPTGLSVVPNNMDSVIWNHGTSGGSVIVVPGATYTATGYLNGCSTQVSHTINAIPNPLDVFNNIPFCSNRTNTINVTPGKVSYVWNGVPGNETYTLTGSSPNPTVLTVESANGCVRTDSIHFVLQPTPDIAFSPDAFCGGNIVPFINQTTIDSPSTVAGYAWLFGDGTNSTLVNPEHEFPSSGNYSVSLIAFSDQACIDTLTKDFRVHPNPVANFNAEPLCFGLYLFSDSTKLGDTTLMSYQWTFDVNNDTVNLDFFEYQFGENVNQVEVTYTVVDEFGCSSDTTRIITIEEPPQFSKLPNIITPNGDGINDKFEIPASFDKCFDYSIRFFNRWGQKVYDITQSTMAFDGTNSLGAELEDGVYYYVIMANGKKVLNGTVTVVRGGS